MTPPHVGAACQRCPPGSGSRPGADRGETESLRGHDRDMDGDLNGDRLDELFRHCADLGVDVMWKDLGDKRRGEYHRDDDTIVLSPRLTGRQAVACLAHELGHHRFGHACSSPANERRAWEYGAALVLTPAEYAVAEARVGRHPGALAIELGVTPQLVEAWRRWWHKRGARVSPAVLVEDARRA